MRAGGRESGGHAFTGVRDQRRLCPFVLSTVEKPLRGSEAGTRNQLSISFWEKNKSTILSLGHQLVRNPEVKFLCVSSSFCAGLISSVTGNIAKIGRGEQGARWALWVLEAQRRLNWLREPVGGGSGRGNGDTRARRQMHLQEGADRELARQDKCMVRAQGLLGHAEGLGMGLGVLWRERLPQRCVRNWVCVSQ